jgi:hypothetical protein
LFPSFSGALPDHNNRPFNPDFTPDLWGRSAGPTALFHFDRQFWYFVFCILFFAFLSSSSLYLVVGCELITFQLCLFRKTDTSTLWTAELEASARRFQRVTRLFYRLLSLLLHSQHGSLKYKNSKGKSCMHIL